LEELVVVGRRDPQNFTGGVVGVAVADAVAFGERAVEENEAGVVLAQALE
jgi:Na+/alanine symporter